MFVYDGTYLWDVASNPNMYFSFHRIVFQRCLKNNEKMLIGVHEAITVVIHDHRHCDLHIERIGS